MNGPLLAALVVVALVVIALVLKKQAAQKKTEENEAALLLAPQPATVTSEELELADDLEADSVLTEQDAIPGIAEPDEISTNRPEDSSGTEAAADADKTTEETAQSLAPQPPTVTSEEIELVDLEADSVLAEQDATPEFVELEAVESETPSALEIETTGEKAPAVAETQPTADSAAPPEAVETIVAVNAVPIAAAETIRAVEEKETPPSGSRPADAVEPAAAIDTAANLPPAQTSAVPVIHLTLEAYSARLNRLEEKQRAILTEAIDRRDDSLRDRLQRELVIMNDKLALLADSYVEEVACYQQVLEVLKQLQVTVGGPGLETAIEHLQAGEADPAEEFLAGLSKQAPPFAGRIAYCRGRLAESRVDLQKALALYQAAVEQEEDNLHFLQAAGRTARSLYQYRTALPVLESLVRLSREKDACDPLALALAQRELAYTYVLSGQYQKAGPLYKESMTVLAKKLGQDHPEMATSWFQIGELQETLGEYDKAVSLYKKALAILEKKRGPEHPVLASILDKLAALCMELEMEKEAVPLYERLVRIREKALRPTHPQLAISLNSLAESYRLQGRYADAFACYQKSLVINESLHGKEHPSVAAILQELAKLCANQRKPEEASEFQERAAAIFQKSVEAAEQKSGAEALTLEL